MTVKKTKKKINSKVLTDKKVKKKNVGAKKSKGKRYIEKERKINPNVLAIITFFSGVLLIISSYAWFSASLDVKVKFLDLVVSSDSGLFISLDGIDYSSSVEISLNSVINDLKSTYPHHTNQWSTGGLWPVSSNGIKNKNSPKFDVYIGEVSLFRGRHGRRFLNTRLITQDESSSSSAYIAFDLFLKNVSGSPKSDNLYLDEGTFVDFEEDTEEDVMDSMSNIMNSMRIGFVKIASVPSKTEVNIVQNLTCNNNCEMVIYEPNSTLHSETSINKAQEAYNFVLVDGNYVPTYAVIKEGDYLDHINGLEGSGIPLDPEHFTLQKTITNFDKPIFQIPNGVTKLRAYVWIEGQDVDSLETNSEGAAIYISINFVKDLAGYE